KPIRGPDKLKRNEKTPECYTKEQRMYPPYDRDIKLAILGDDPVQENCGPNEEVLGRWHFPFTEAIIGIGDVLARNVGITSLLVAFFRPETKSADDTSKIPLIGQPNNRRNKRLKNYRH